MFNIQNHQKLNPCLFSDPFEKKQSETRHPGSIVLKQHQFLQIMIAKSKMGNGMLKILRMFLNCPLVLVKVGSH